MLTQRRQSFDFPTIKGAESFAEAKHETGAKDVVVTLKGTGATVYWTEENTD